MLTGLSRPSNNSMVAFPHHSIHSCVITRGKKREAHITPLFRSADPFLHVVVQRPKLAHQRTRGVMYNKRACWVLLYVNRCKEGIGGTHRCANITRIVSSSFHPSMMSNGALLVQIQWSLKNRHETRQPSIIYPVMLG